MQSTVLADDSDVLVGDEEVHGQAAGESRAESDVAEAAEVAEGDLDVGLVDTVVAHPEVGAAVGRRWDGP